MHIVLNHNSSSTYGRTECFLNGIFIDACDMDFTRNFTQAHLVLAGVAKTLDIPVENITVSIEGHIESPKLYPIEKIQEMAKHAVSWVQSYRWSDSFINSMFE